MKVEENRMGEMRVGLKLKDMYAIKHGLQKQLAIKENDLMVMKGTTIWEENIEQYERLKKDVAHERRLVEDFELYIKFFKEKNHIK